MRGRSRRADRDGDRAGRCQPALRRDRLRCRADGEVHHSEAARGSVALLAVDADVAEPAAVGFDEFFRLHEHAAGTAAGVVNAAFVRAGRICPKFSEAHYRLRHDINGRQATPAPFVGFKQIRRRTTWAGLPCAIG